MIFGISRAWFRYRRNDDKMIRENNYKDDTRKYGVFWFLFDRR